MGMLQPLACVILMPQAACNHDVVGTAGNCHGRVINGHDSALQVALAVIVDSEAKLWSMLFMQHQQTVML